MIAKTDKNQFYFQVQLHWQEGRKGIITANDVKDTIRVATPPKFSGGVPDMWSPEHLFLSSLSSCFMSTYMALASKQRLNVEHFDCSAIGQVAQADGQLEFITINLFPKIYVEKETDIPLANEVMLNTYRQSIVINSIKPHLIQHGQVLLEKHRVQHSAEEI
ncbi:MAG: OsmC family protein [Bacteroidetes bacterium]|nr:OsmC family protein [Bacteroidota bacterium]